MTPNTVITIYKLNHKTLH